MNFLSSLVAAERQAFAAVALERTFARGDRLMQEGEETNYVVVILSGWTQVTVRENGSERVIAERGPGQLLGERSALRVNAQPASAIALETVHALVMRTADFASFVSAHPRVLDIVENQIYGRLTEQSAGHTWAEPERPAETARFAGRLVAAATRILPVTYRARYVEEFRSELAEIACSGGGRWSQIMHAVRLLAFAWSLRGELRDPQRRRALP